MNPSEPTDLLVREEHPEATVIRLRVRVLNEAEPLGPLRDALLRLAESGTGRLVLDLTEVEHLGSAALGWLLVLRKKLTERGRAFQPPCRRGLFAFFEDASAALEAIRQGEPDPLLLCGARREIRELFHLC